MNTLQFIFKNGEGQLVWPFPRVSWPTVPRIGEAIKLPRIERQLVVIDVVHRIDEGFIEIWCR